MSATIEPGRSAVIDGVSWETYRRLRDEAGPATRITYDDGRMEIMAPISMGHGGRTKLICRLLETYLDHAGIAYTGVDVVTLARDDLQKGCEGDQMYYIHAEPPPPETEELDLSVHNPPDLVIEVDLASSSVPKEPIYAAIGVTELWRLEAEALRVGVLASDRTTYANRDGSALLPGLDVAALRAHIRLGRTMPQSDVVARWGALLSNGS